MSEPVPVDTSIEFRVRRLLRPTEDVVAWHAAIAALDAEAAAPVLAAILDRPGELDDARGRAASLLGQLGGPEAVPLLARHAAAGDTGLIRARSVLALAAVGAATSEARAAVAACLADDDAFVRESAARVAGFLGLDDAGPALEAMRDGDPVEKNRAEAAAALAAIRDPG